MLKQLFNALLPQKEIPSVIPNPQSEEELHISELRYRRLFETAQDGILILDADSGKIVDVNPFLEKLLGFSKQDFSGKELWQIGVFKDIGESKIAFKELKTKGYIRYKNLPLKTKDGRSIYVEFVSNVYVVGDQSVIQCNIRDITEQKKAEDNLVQEKIKDEAILASIGDGVLVTDKEGRVTLMNSAAETLLGWSNEEFLGKSVFDVLHVEDKTGNPIATTERPTQIALTTGKKIASTVTSHMYYYLRKNGTKFPAAVTVTPVILHKEIVGAIDIFRDITQEEATDKAKNEFISIASHQLLTPLGITKWYLSVLQKDTYLNDAPKKFIEYFNIMSQNNERVLAIVHELLSVSRIDDGQIKNVPKSISIIDAVIDVVKELQPLAQKKEIALNLEIKHTKLPNILIDPLRFHEAVENLIANAIEYTPKAGKVTVTVDKKSHDASIAIKDTGIGLSAGEQKDLFTKFFRAQKAVSENPGGSGLGLYVVKSYVEAWGGKITVESVEEKGSTFTILLPIKQLTSD